MTKHTPGPWKTEPAGNMPDGYVVNEHGEAIALVDRYEGQTEEERRANARLLSAAPALFTELKALREALRADGWVPPRGFSLKASDDAIAAAQTPQVGEKNE